MGRLKVIVNPLAGKGHGAKVSPLIDGYLRSLGAEFDMVFTRYSGEAIQLAREAAEDGYDTVVAVGGDGTSHEVVNGIMAAHSGASEEPAPSILGCIPAGSGNDFATMNGAPTDPKTACELIVQGVTRSVDIGQVILDGEISRHFGNAVGIGFDALVTLETRKMQYLRGMALYVPAVLRTIFRTMRPMDMTIICDGEAFRQTNLVTIIANGPREGGGFFVAPDAQSDDGLFDLVTAADMSRLSMLGMVPRFMQGTHIGHRLISIKRAGTIDISSPDPLFVHVDGEILSGEVHRVQTRILPRCLRMIAPQREVGP